MPPTPAIVPTPASTACSSRRSRLVWTTLYALLLGLLACLGDQLHTPERPYGHLAAASSEVPSPERNFEGDGIDVPELPGRCTGARSEAAALSSARVPPPTATAASLTDVPEVLSHDPRGAVRRLLPSGGRSALVSLCQWRI
ncbi:hypothetical protein [Streptomyces sp. DSM 40750]|uniref:hypothetical protein n=1 Tax=Streptomyces sp. DSM 40750 TaxID=2801030 RepID=UPI00214BBC8C|nr:hypothetical protein [Streptomyces sp. DSM 40750]UUU25243.1 hypothetical protein JIX55_36100 [Streptomyces sp. DSM 40750]